MTRRTAAERHCDSAPESALGAEASAALLDVLMAIHHPTRRWLAELLYVEGPASVGQLAARTGLAVGSVSHHLKPLHRHGFVEPAPDLARDTRESWWRAVRRKSLSWSAEDFETGSPGRRIADAAEAENFRHQMRATRQWLTSGDDDEAWRRAARSIDTLVPASTEQLTDFGERLAALIADWSAECLAERDAHPDVVRRPVRVIARAFPSEPVRP